jgi:predicted aspartyl protease
MSTAFNAQQGLIILRALLWGPTGQRSVQLALDTGATSTLVNTAILVTLGYDPAVSPDRVQMTTGSGVEYVPRLATDRIRVLGQERVNFALVAHTLPPSASVDGLLGLDFLRGQELMIDFRNGQLTLR